MMVTYIIMIIGGSEDVGTESDSNSDSVIDIAQNLPHRPLQKSLS